jgi:hypothetical protein
MLSPIVVLPPWHRQMSGKKTKRSSKAEAVSSG